MHREICAAILPRPNLTQTLNNDWHEIAEGLAESKRKRDRFRLRDVNAYGAKPLAS